MQYPRHRVLPEAAIKKLVDASQVERRVKRNESFKRRVAIDEAIAEIKKQFPNYFV